MASNPSITDIQQTILAQTVIAANAAAAAAQAAQQAIAGAVPAPTSATLPRNSYAFCFQRSGVGVADGVEVDGVNVYPACWSNGGWAQGAAQVGKWKNISGITLQDNDIGWLVRTE